jgi:2-oxoglutarate ferredoxin oxidoreductase subunit delta
MDLVLSLLIGKYIRHRGAAAIESKRKVTPRAQLGYIKILDHRCKGCDLCIPACPTDIIAKAGAERVNWMGWIPVEVTDMRLCIACNLCAMVCPDQAIEVYRFAQPVPHEATS